MEKFPYEDLLHFPYPNPEIERDFPDKVLRAAQFAPFAALTGYDDAVAETARLTEQKVELDEDIKAHLDAKLQRLKEMLGVASVSVTYFVPDPKKAGGKYLVHQGVIAAVKEFERELVFQDGTGILLDNIIALEGEMFDEVSCRERSGKDENV